ncbi:hypothetical protein BDV28DRAFT_138591 [Aspergillus coremiiformis]|uniref:Uncharacterized protein n=1 Tax=Aspergillus coremiiformis TaxID=138285 RepID=A0A5N6Z1Y2_9EURO|nr:hypothetical protein BDV28DRAFT_138591 [Aspergillus coremiiformis]
MIIIPITAAKRPAAGLMVWAAPVKGCSEGWLEGWAGETPVGWVGAVGCSGEVDCTGVSPGTEGWTGVSPGTEG